MQYRIERVEISEDKEQLIFHTRDVDDCKRLWCQLYGQSRDYTEGHKPIPFDIQENSPNDTTLDILIDTDQILRVLTYLEVELEFYKYLAPGTTAEIQKQLEVSEKSPAQHEDGEPHQGPVDDELKYSPK